MKSDELPTKSIVENKSQIYLQIIRTDNIVCDCDFVCFIVIKVMKWWQIILITFYVCQFVFACVSADN